MKKKLTFLGIETSCDETAASIVIYDNKKPHVISNIISSQIKSIWFFDVTNDRDL